MLSPNIPTYYFYLKFLPDAPVWCSYLLFLLPFYQKIRLAHTAHCRKIWLQRMSCVSKVLLFYVTRKDCMFVNRMPAVHLLVRQKVKTATMVTTQVSPRSTLVGRTSSIPPWLVHYKSNVHYEVATTIVVKQEYYHRIFATKWSS